MKLFTAAVIATAMAWAMAYLRCEGSGIACMIGAVLFLASAAVAEA